jgi:F-type H+-transporting ATPase subunit epsilon
MFTVQIITPERLLAPIQGEHVTLCTVDGEIGVRTGHLPVVGSLKPSFAMVRSGGKDQFWAFSEGTAQVTATGVNVFVERAAAVTDINVAEVEAKLTKLQATAAPTDATGKRLRDLDMSWLQAQLAAVVRSKR